MLCCWLQRQHQRQSSPSWTVMDSPFFMLKAIYRFPTWLQNFPILLHCPFTRFLNFILHFPFTEVSRCSAHVGSNKRYTSLNQPDVFMHQKKKMWLMSFLLCFCLHESNSENSEQLNTETDRYYSFFDYYRSLISFLIQLYMQGITDCGSTKAADAFSEAVIQTIRGMEIFYLFQ